MQVLIIKTSSLGDIIHTLPALTDAGKVISGISFDWVVEENFAEIPAWHPLVDSVIPVALRRWRKNPLRALYNKEWRMFSRQLKAKSYDMIIDAQGLIKSAILCRLARGLRVGLDKQSLTEPLARFAYQKTVTVDLQKHAIHRMRNIFAQALQYSMPSTTPDYGISVTQFNNRNQSINILNKEINDYFVFLHGTTWKSKLWPDNHWLQLAKLIAKAEHKILMPWNSQDELARANYIAQNCDNAYVMPKMNLAAIANLVTNAKGVISIDTGLAHLAAALNVPTITLYGPTNPQRIGTIGVKQKHIITDYECEFCDKPTCKRKKSKSSSVCLATITPQTVSSLIF